MSSTDADPKLIRAMLEYFMEGQESQHLAKQFPDRDRKDLLHRMRALSLSGLLVRAYGTTRGAVYVTTALGKYVLKELQRIG